MRKIIVSDVEREPGSFTVTAFFWLDVPPLRGLKARQVSRMPEASEGAPWGSTPQERTQFTRGVVTERMLRVGPFAENATAANVQASLLVAYTAEQARLNATAGSLDIVGISWDGTAWDEQTSMAAIARAPAR